MDKGHYLAQAKQHINTESGIAFQGLLMALVEDLRKRNDTATYDDVLRNQGAISEFNKLLKSLTSKIDDENRKDYTGGFGS